MRIRHEAIYQSLYVQGRGALRRELTACLRTGRALRMPRARTRGKGKSFLSPEIMISERPAEAADRAVPGHWEGDLILGLGSSAIGTLVERTTLLHLPRMPAHGKGVRVKNGPALAGHGAEAVRDAIVRSVVDLPDQLRRSLTWDQGAEMAQHATLKVQAGLRVFFCDPPSPWQRGTNENTNGLLRQYFPKGTDLCRHSADELAAVAAALNARPRKTLDWRTPAEALDAFLQKSKVPALRRPVESAQYAKGRPRLGQRGHGELLLLQGPRRSVRLRRALLQSEAPPFETGLPQPRGAREEGHAGLTARPRNRQQLTERSAQVATGPGSGKTECKGG
jgi:IS30 family transposase